jgi:hypothetical protein
VVGSGSSGNDLEESHLNSRRSKLWTNSSPLLWRGWNDCWRGKLQTNGL